LVAKRKHRSHVPVYATINRALTTRSLDDYLQTVDAAVQQGFNAIKCAPFEAVTADGDQVRQSEHGLTVLAELRRRFPDLSIRIDFHERFRLDAFSSILPLVEANSPAWLESPLPIGPRYSDLRELTRREVALGELFFGYARFGEIIEKGWADVIMPDVKHVGGFGPLVDVMKRCGSGAKISPHNPSGPVATLASVHAAAACEQVPALELPLIKAAKRAYYLDWMRNGCAEVPDGIGWGAEEAFA
jgi:galactonate dehydratase